MFNQNSFNTVQYNLIQCSNISIQNLELNCKMVMWCDCPQHVILF